MVYINIKSRNIRHFCNKFSHSSSHLPLPPPTPPCRVSISTPNPTWPQACEIANAICQKGPKRIEQSSSQIKLQFSANANGLASAGKWVKQGEKQETGIGIGTGTEIGLKVLATHEFHVDFGCFGLLICV